MNTSNYDVNIINTPDALLASNSCDVVLLQTGALKMTLPSVGKQLKQLRIVNQSLRECNIFGVFKDPLEVFISLRGQEYIDLLPYQIGNYYITVGQGSTIAGSAVDYNRGVTLALTGMTENGAGAFDLSNLQGSNNWSIVLETTNIDYVLLLKASLNTTAYLTLTAVPKTGVDCIGTIYEATGTGVITPVATSTLSGIGSAFVPTASIVYARNISAAPFRFAIGSTERFNLASLNLYITFKETGPGLIPVV